MDVTPLRESRELRLLFAGQSTNLLGSQVRLVAVPYLVFQLTDSSLMVGLLGLAQFLPGMVFSLLGGTLADAMDRKRLLLITQVLLAIGSGILATAVVLGSPPIWLIFAVLMFTAGIGAIDNPTRRAAVSRLVPREQLASALALNQIIMQTGNVIGPAVTGVLLATVGVSPALVIDTLTFGLSIAFIWRMAPMPPAAGEAGPRPGLKATLEGLAFLKDKPVLKSAFLVDINAMFFGAPTSLFPALAENVFKTGPAGLGLLYAAPGAGALTGALLSGWVGRVRRQGLAVVLAVMVWGVCITCFGLLSSAFWLALVFLAIAHAADQYSAVFRGAILQLAVPDRLRGRLSAVHFFVVSGGPQLGNFEAGAVATATSVRFSVVSGGLATIAGTALIALLLPAFVRYDALAEPEPG